MEIIKKTNEYSIVKKRSGRFGVRSKNRTWVGGDDKLKILVDEGMIKLPKAKPKPAATEDEAAASE